MTKFESFMTWPFGALALEFVDAVYETFNQLFASIVSKTYIAKFMQIWQILYEQFQKYISCI